MSLTPAPPWFARARRQIEAGRLDQARRLLDSHSIRDHYWQARVELARAAIESESGDTASAERRCRTLLLSDPDSEIEARAHLELGALAVKQGEERLALRHFDTVVELSDDPEIAGLMHFNRGNVFLQAGAPDKAAEDFQQAETLLAQAGFEVRAAMSGHNLGYALMQMGQLTGALTRMESAREQLDAVSAFVRAICDQDLAQVHTAAGQPQMALLRLRTAVQTCARGHLALMQAEAEWSLAQAELRSDPARAYVIARRAARRFRANHAEVWALRADALSMAAQILRGRTAPSLVGAATRIAVRLREVGQLQEATVLEIQTARLENRRGQPDAAQARLDQIVLTEHSPITTRLLLAEVRAEVAENEGDGAAVRATATAALDVLHQWQATFGSIDLQTTVVAHGEPLTRLGLRAAVASGDVDVLLEWSERARSLAARVTSVSPPANPAQADDLTRLRVLAGSGASSELERLWRQVTERSWYAEGTGDVEDLVERAELADRLRQHDATLIAHIVLDDHLTALVLTPDTGRIVDLGTMSDIQEYAERVRADLDVSAQHHGSAFATAIRASLDDSLAHLDERLLGPLVEHLHGARVVLTPSAALAGVPWTMLPGLAGRPVTVPQSATRWARSQPVTITSAGLAAGPRVPRAVEEITRIADVWPHSVMAPSIEAAAMNDLATSVDLLHIAAHGSHESNNPMFAAFELEDGPWFGHDIATLPQVPAVVVLSACELGRSTARHSEESMGMSATWLHAGSRVVLSAPSLVADDLACDALVAWHRLVATGMAPADALAQVVSTSPGPLPFVCFGNGF